MYKGFVVSDGLLRNLQRSKDASLSSNLRKLIYESKEYELKDDSEEVREILRNALSADFIDAGKVADSLFPDYDVDIFLSHSFKDRDLANFFAIKMKEIGLKVFIDSYVWGSAYDLLNEIDKVYCYNEVTDTFDYKRRNASTSHVYMILNSALHRMIDRSEAFVFLSTDNSIVGFENLAMSGDVESRTYSPWIHSELMFSSLVKKTNSRRPEMIVESAAVRGSMEAHDELRVAHSAKYKHLLELSGNIFSEWMKEAKEKEEHPLDILYKLY